MWKWFGITKFFTLASVASPATLMPWMVRFGAVSDVRFSALAMMFALLLPVIVIFFDPLTTLIW